MSYYRAVFVKGALTQRERALMALEVARSAMPLWHRHLYAGLSRKGIQCRGNDQAVHGACAIRSGVSLVQGVQIRNVAEQLSL